MKLKTILRNTHQTQNKTEKEKCKKRVTFKNVNKKCRTKNHGRKSSQKINIMYANINGATGKANSLITAAQTNSSHIITLAETKITSHPPKINGYSWLTKNRNYNQGGGVAILIRDDIKHTCQQITDLEDQDQDICWMKMHTNNSALHIGVYYGKQEQAPEEQIREEFSKLTTQINKLKQNGEVILTGDFNAKLEVNNDQANQNQSRNGKIMADLLKNTGLQPISLKANIGIWTRENRNNCMEKSIIDYIIATPEVAKQTKNIIIDEIGTLRMKGRKETDHNTITMETTCQIRKSQETRRIWRTNNEEAWDEFNKEMQNTPEEITTDYNKFEKLLNKTMSQTLGKITIRPGKKRKITNPEINRLRQQKKQAKKEMEKACKKGTEQREKLHKYLTCQNKLREKIEEQECKNIEKITKEIISRGGTNSQQFWKIRKRITKQNGCDYDLVTEDGTKITDPDEHKEHIAKYYEDLYTAREGNPLYKKWTNHIKRMVASIDAILQHAPDEEPFTEKELDTAIKSLKKGKCPGPDNIPNEIFIKANKNTKKVYLKMFNHIITQGVIPEQWQNGNITRLYKGKGVKGKCSNERGITLASNVGKLFERMVNNRATTTAQMTDAQAGGKKGRATVDHLLAFKEAVNSARKKKGPVYATFLDVTKAYDKAWIDAILYVMYKRGITSKLWKTIKKLNENLTATIHTKHGPTRKIKIKDSIRQGGVLSVLQYALLMDEISKEVKEKDLGIEIPDTTTKLACCYGWMMCCCLKQDPKKNKN